MELRKTAKIFLSFTLIAGLSISISCTDVDPGNSAPLLVEDAFLVAENAAIGEVIGSVQAVDLDEDVITYAIVNGNEEDKFLIDEASGELSLKNTLNMDQTDSYSLTIRASDGEKFSEKVYEVEVLDENDEKVLIANLLTAAPWLYESVTLDGTEDDSWSNFEIEFDGNVNGGSYTSEESANLQIWPTEDTWEFEDRGNNIVRAIDGQEFVIEEISETQMIVTFTIGSQNARTTQTEGDWKFTFIHE